MYLQATVERFGKKKKKLHNKRIMNARPLFFRQASLSFSSLFLLFILGNTFAAEGQVAKMKSNNFGWEKIDTFQNVPEGITIWYTDKAIEGKPNRAFAVKIPIKTYHQKMMAAVGEGKRLTPDSFYTQLGNPFLIINTSFFTFTDNRNLNIVVNDGQLLAYNTPVKKEAKTSRVYYTPVSALGIDRRGRVDAAWTYTDTADRFPYAVQKFTSPVWDSISANTDPSLAEINRIFKKSGQAEFKKWRMKTAVGGGPMLVQDGKVRVYHKEERQFVNGEKDLHPRSAIGYTKDGYLLVLAVEGRNNGVAAGVTMQTLGEMMVDLGAWEGLNLDGGGSSCLLIRGKPTIKVSDPTGQRPIPAVFYLQ